MADCKNLHCCLQAEIDEQSNLMKEMANKLEIVTTDVTGLGR